MKEQKPKIVRYKIVKPKTMTESLEDYHDREFLINGDHTHHTQQELALRDIAKTGRGPRGGRG